MNTSVRAWIVAAATIAAVSSLASAPAWSQQQRRVIRITAERFTFTPSEIVVSAGEDVEFRLKSDDTAHGFRIASTPVSVVIGKRGRSEVVVPFTAPTKPGRYEFECTRMCGAGHNFMRGVLVVR